MDHIENLMIIENPKIRRHHIATGTDYVDQALIRLGKKFSPGKVFCLRYDADAIHAVTARTISHVKLLSITQACRRHRLWQHGWQRKTS